MEESDVFTENQEALVGHANARLTVHGRRLLVRRVLEHGRPVAHGAKEMGISRQCAHRWVARFRAEGEGGLVDCSSLPRRTPAELEARVLALRGEQRRGFVDLPAGTAATLHVSAAPGPDPAALAAAPVLRTANDLRA